MKKKNVTLLACCFLLMGIAGNAQNPVTYSGTQLPKEAGWHELRFDASIPWEEATKNLLADPSELSAAVSTALKLNAPSGLYSQLGYYKANTGFSAGIGFTVEFKAKVVNAAPGSFSVYGFGSGKGFRLELSNSLLTEHANVLDTARVLSTASAADGFHTYRVAVAPDNKVYVWRDGVSLGSLPLQSFKADNIFDDGGFENGENPEAHGWKYDDRGPEGQISVSSDPAHAHSGKYGLFVDKGRFINEFLPAKSGARYDASVWVKKITYNDTPEGQGNEQWRDFNGWYDPAGDRALYGVIHKDNNNWEYYENKNKLVGGQYQRFIVETPTGSENSNQSAFDEIYYSEQIAPSRIPANAVNLFPNGDFEDPDYPYFPAGDPRNDTTIVVNCDGNECPFWHPFWGARVRIQNSKQSGNEETGNYWARSGRNSLRYYTCGQEPETYYGDPAWNDNPNDPNDRRGANSPLHCELDLQPGKTYTFSFWYHTAKWPDRMELAVANGSQEVWRQRIERNDDNNPYWINQICTFTTTAENHTLKLYSIREGHCVVYFDDFFLFEGQPLPEYDGSYLFFGKPTGKKGANVEIESISYDNTGAYAPDGNLVVNVIPYEKQTAPLMTVWGEALQATDPILDEYPRPQLKREGWTNLNGIWNFTRKTKEAFGAYSASDRYLQQILVPYPIESALSGIMELDYNNQSKSYAYQRNVTIAKPGDDKRVILHFDAVDWESCVFVNGTQVAHHKGGYDPFAADITDALNASGDQEIVVQIYDPTKGGQPSGKQFPNPQGSDYSPASGIWQTVWTEVVNPAYITGLELTPVDNTAVKVKVEAAGAEGLTATVTVLDGTSTVGSANVAAGAETTINIASPKLWSPETPFLYNVKVELKKNGAATDEVTSYFGLRKIEVKMLRNKPFIYLNDKPVFSYATLDHGYFPDGIYTPASYEALRHDLKKLKELGFNAVRKFEKIEPAIWYHLADSLGLLVWQDIPAAQAGTPVAELNTEAARKANFLRETEAMTKSIRNFPSIVAWIGFNDGWGQYSSTIDHTRNTVDLLRSLKDGRLIVPESGSDNFELGDVASSLGLPIPNVFANAYNERALICGVTGNYSYAISGHVWNPASSSDIKTDADYAARLQEFSDAAKGLTLANISGLAMVQTTDVENEINGLMTYDRKVYKYATTDSVAGKVLKESIGYMKTKIVAPLVKTQAQGGDTWKYLAGAKDMPEPEAGWNTSAGFDDSNWLTGMSAFGSRESWNTSWGSTENCGLYLRKVVHIPVLEAGDELKFTMFYDDDYEFYINGVPASSATGWIDSHKTLTISDEAKAAINYGGDNLFAIHVIQNVGGAYMDLGVSADKLYHPIDWEETVPAPVWKDIATAQDWLNIKNDLNGFYRLTADIDLYNVDEYAPLGNTNNPFKGYIDGQNHTVTCPEINGGDRLGLFGYANGAYFVNLRFVEASVHGGADVGILLGRGKGITVDHVVFDQGQYQNEVRGRDHVGIVAGLFESGKLSIVNDVYVVNGKVESTEWQAAGLVGIICDTRISNSYFTGTVAITSADRLTADNRDAAVIAARTEGGKNQLMGVMSLATKVLSASGNEWVSYNGGGNLAIDSATCFVRNDMELDPLFAPGRGGQFARAAESMKRPVADFKAYSIYRKAGWDMTNVWGIPKGGGFPIFRYLGSDDDFEPGTAIPAVKKANDLKVYSTYGNIVMTSSQPTAVWIYNLQGSLVERTDVNGTRTVSLPLGVYIVKSVANGNVNAIKVLNR